jgi:hypothetical protein
VSEPELHPPRLPDDEQRLRRGLKFRKREDHAVELFREAFANLTDVARVNRILLELGRFYNPYTNQPIVDLDTRKRVVGLLEAGDVGEAAPLLRERLDRYASGDPGPEPRG